MTQVLGPIYDSVSADKIPTDGAGVLAYVNGLYANAAALRSRFPALPLKTISVYGLDAVALAAHIADCENGDYTPTNVALWAHLKITGGYGRPTIYSSTSLYADIAAALAAYGLEFGRDVDWFEANYDGLAVISPKPGAIAKQYQSNDNYDVSIVYMDWLHGSTPTPPAPPTALYSPVPPPLALLLGGSAMAALDKMDMLIGTVNWAYLEYLGRPVDQGGEETYTTILNEQGITAVIKFLVSSPEGKAYQAAKRKSLGL